MHKINRYCWAHCCKQNWSQNSLLFHLTPRHCELSFSVVNRTIYCYSLFKRLDPVLECEHQLLICCHTVSPRRKRRYRRPTQKMFDQSYRNNIALIDRLSILAYRENINPIRIQRNARPVLPIPYAYIVSAVLTVSSKTLFLLKFCTMCSKYSWNTWSGRNVFKIAFSYKGFYSHMVLLK